MNFSPHMYTSLINLAIMLQLTNSISQNTLPNMREKRHMQSLKYSKFGDK